MATQPAATASSLHEAQTIEGKTPAELAGWLATLDGAPKQRATEQIAKTRGNAVTHEVLELVRKGVGASLGKQATIPGKWTQRVVDKTGTEKPDRLPRRLGIGDRLVAEFQPAPIQDMPPISNYRPVITGAGAQLFTVEHRADGGGQSVALEAIKFGYATPAIQLRGGTMEQPIASPSLETSASIEMPAETFAGQATTALGHVVKNYVQAIGWADGLSANYQGAWLKHTQIIASSGKKENLAAEFAYEGLKVVVGGTLGGRVGAVLVALGADKYLAEGLKDLVKFTVRKGRNVSANSPAPVAPSPDAFASSLRQRLNQEMTVAVEVVSAWLDASQPLNPDPNFAFDFDPVERIQDALTVGGTRLVRLTSPPTIDDLERSLWRSWLERYGYVLDMHLSAPDDGWFKPWPYQGRRLEHYARNNVTDRIRTRCKQLGIDVAATAEVAHDRVQEEADALNDPSRGDRT